MPQGPRERGCQERLLPVEIRGRRRSSASLLAVRAKGSEGFQLLTVGLDDMRSDVPRPGHPQALPEVRVEAPGLAMSHFRVRVYPGPPGILSSRLPTGR